MGNVTCGNMLTSYVICVIDIIMCVHAMQDEALRPFVAVLRHADNALVREMTVQVVSQAVTTNPKGLGSGTPHRTCTLSFTLHLLRLNSTR